MATYAADQDVTDVLGVLAGRLPAFVSIPRSINVAHATVLDVLAQVYPTSIPTFTGDGLDVVRYAEAKLAAAEILEQIRINLPDLGDAPDRLVKSAMSALVDGVVGYPIGSVDSETPGGGGGTTTTVPGPRMSSFTPVSAFPDPYDAARLNGGRFL